MDNPARETTVCWHSWTIPSIPCQIIHNCRSVSSSGAAIQSNNWSILISARYLSYPARSNYWLTSRSLPATIFLCCSALISLTFSSMALTAKSHLGTIRSAVGGRTSSGCSTWKYCDPWRDGKNRRHATGIHGYSPSFNCARRSCCRFVGRPFRPYNDIL